VRKKLTSSQEDALTSLLREGPVDDVAATVRFGSAWRRTLTSLAERGFARHFPSARASDGSRSGVWRITPAGKGEAHDLEAIELQRELKRKEDEVVQRWRERNVDPKTNEEQP